MQKAFKEVIEEKIKVTCLEIIVTGTKDKPYFEIKYKEVGKEDYHIGYSSYDLNNVFGWKEECFEIVNQVAEEYKSTEHINCSTEEVCEWREKSVDSIKLVREPHRLRLFHIEEERQYCPYCGKKIKVVK